MAKKSSTALGTEFVLQICLGLFLLALGILGITSYKSDLSGVMRFLGKNDTLNLVTAIVEIAMGAILVIALFASIKGSLGQALGVILAALWAVIMILAYFVSNAFEPTFLGWLVGFARDLVVLVALWSVGKRLGSA